MPTYSRAPEFVDDYRRLSPDRRTAFRSAVQKLVDDLRRGELRAGLRVKRVKSRSGVWELTWAADGRATFEYGEEVLAGHPHIIWRRIGSHDVLDNP